MEEHGTPVLAFQEQAMRGRIISYVRPLSPQLPRLYPVVSTPSALRNRRAWQRMLGKSARNEHSRIRFNHLSNIVRIFLMRTCHLGNADTFKHGTTDERDIGQIVPPRGGRNLLQQFQA